MSVDERYLRDLLSYTQEQIAEGEAALETATGRTAHVIHYGLFEDAISAAGAARGLGDEDAAKELLARAARAAVEVFHTRQEALQHTGDDSGANAWTLIQGLYAALASGSAFAERELATLGPEDLDAVGFEISDTLRVLAEALLHAVRGENPAMIDVLDCGLSTASPDEGDRFWRSQSEVLRCLAADDESGATNAMAEVIAEVDREFGGDAEPERLLALPVLGLRVLLERSS